MRSITDHLTLLVELLKRAIGVHLDRQARLRPHVPTMGLAIDYTPPQPSPGPSPLPQQAYELLWHRAHRIAHRFLALFGRWQSKTLPTPRIPPQNHPQAGRPHRARPPEYLRLPPRPRKPRAPKSPKPPRPSLNDPTLKWRGWELRAARASIKKYGRG